MNSSLVEVLARRRDRSIAIVLGLKERECDHCLSMEVSQKLRKVILDQFNELTDLAIDMLRSSEEGIPNRAYFERLEKLLEQAVDGL